MEKKMQGAVEAIKIHRASLRIREEQMTATLELKRVSTTSWQIC